MAIPTIDELLGNVIELRNGDKFLVVKRENKIIGLSKNIYGITITGCFNDELQEICNSNLDIMKVYTINNYFYVNLNNCFDVDRLTIIWDRDENQVKEMTVADVEKLVGCTVKIVK